MNIENWIEHILITAKVRRTLHKFPHRFEGIENYLKDCDDRVTLACHELDKLGASWTIQNSALHWVNIYDENKADDLWGISLKELAKSIANNK